MDSHFKISVDDVNVTREERNGKDRVIQKKNGLGELQSWASTDLLSSIPEKTQK